MTTLLAFYVGAGVLLSAISVPLMLRKIGPNPVYGFRVKQTLENPVVWYEVNAYAARRLLVDGLLIALAAVVLYAVPGIGIDRYALSVTAIAFLALGLTMIASVRYLHRFHESDSSSPCP
jgi:hypothetical protein